MEVKPLPHTVYCFDNSCYCHHPNMPPLPLPPKQLLALKTHHYCILYLLPVVIVNIFLQIHHHYCFHWKQERRGRQFFSGLYIFYQLFIYLFYSYGAITTASIKNQHARKTVYTPCFLYNLLLLLFSSEDAINNAVIEKYKPFPYIFWDSGHSCLRSFPTMTPPRTSWTWSPPSLPPNHT